MTVTFQVEPWETYYDDSQRALLWNEHYMEFESVHKGRMKMKPDVSFYQGAAANGQLFVLVARRHGVMIGYFLVIVRPHVHYCDALCAFEDSYFLTQSERKGLIGYRLIKAALAECTRRGCVKAFFMTKEFNSIELLFERLKFEKSDSVYSIWLRN